MAKKPNDVPVDPAVLGTVDPIYMLAAALWEGWLPRHWLVRLVSGSAHALQREDTSKPRWWQRFASGPVSAAVACCGRIGWLFEQEAPMQPRTGVGIKLDLLTACPRTVQHVARRDCEQWLLDKARHSQGYLAGLRKTPFLRPLQILAHQKPTKEWGYQEQGILKAVVGNAMWNQQRLFEAGLADSDACTVCGETGSGWHGPWGCPATAAFRDNFGLTAAERRGAQRQQTWPMWTHALVEDPRVWLPAPLMDPAVFWTTRPREGLFDGPAYGDGSGMFGNDPTMCRAGWGVITLRQDGPRGGRVVKTAEAHGPLPGMYQLVPAAEAMALLVWLRFLGPPPWTFHTDCAWVKDSWTKGPEGTTGAAHIHADLWREIWARAEDVGREAITLIKVKAHSTMTDVEAGRITGVQRIGNNWADEAARDGAARHPHDEKAWQRVERTSQLITSLAKFLVGYHLQHHRHGMQEKPPKPARGEERARRVRAAESARGGHSVAQIAGKFRCLDCLRVASTQRMLLLMSCQGGSAMATHKLWQSGGGVLFCARCGAYSISKSRLLLRPCRGAPQICGQRALGSLFEAGSWPAGQELHDQFLHELGAQLGSQPEQAVCPPGAQFVQAVGAQLGSQPEQAVCPPGDAIGGAAFSSSILRNREKGPARFRGL